MYCPRVHTRIFAFSTLKGYKKYQYTHEQYSRIPSTVYLSQDSGCAGCSFSIGVYVVWSVRERDVDVKMVGFAGAALETGDGT